MICYGSDGLRAVDTVWCTVGKASVGTLELREGSDVWTVDCSNIRRMKVNELTELTTLGDELVNLSDLVLVPFDLSGPFLLGYITRVPLGKCFNGGVGLFC